jgi:transposase InsO family protein
LYPKTIGVDNDSEFNSREMDLWACQRGVTLDFSRPGKPMDNAYIEAFNSKFRAEWPPVTRDRRSRANGLRSHPPSGSQDFPQRPCRGGD